MQDLLGAMNLLWWNLHRKNKKKCEDEMKKNTMTEGVNQNLQNAKHLHYNLESTHCCGKYWWVHRTMIVFKEKPVGLICCTKLPSIE